MTECINCKTIFGSCSNVNDEILCSEEHCEDEEMRCSSCSSCSTTKECLSLKEKKSTKFFVDPIIDLKCLVNYDYKFGNYPVENLKWRCGKKKKIKYKSTEKSSLGYPIGICFGDLNLLQLKSTETKNYDHLFGFGACIVAFGELYITAEKAWNNIIINRILSNGKELIENSAQNEKFLTEYNVKKRFLLCQNTVEVNISDPILTGRLTSDNMRIWNFRNAIENFMRKYRFCLLMINDCYFLIWRHQCAYFVFDPNGRNVVLERDLNSGHAALICLSRTKNVSHLFLEMSDLNGEELFSLRVIEMIDLIPCCDKVENVEHEMRKNEYKVLNTHHAVLQSRIHVESAIFNEFRFKHSLAIVLTSIIFSKIDPPNTWDCNVFDRVIIMGNKLYKEWFNCNLDSIFNLENVPKFLKFGQFVIELEFCTTVESGLWNLIPNYQRIKLTESIKRAFQMSSNLILHVGNRYYALWKRSNTFYIFDPYTHDSINKNHYKFATLHMCSTIDKLCCILSQQVIEIMDCVPYYIHVVFIKQLIEGNDVKHLQKKKRNVVCRIFKGPDEKDEFKDIVSLNESINEAGCLKDNYDIEEHVEDEPLIDLNSPGFSDTQIVPDYEEIKTKIGKGGDEYGTLTEEELEEEQEENEVGVESEEGEEEEEEEEQKEETDTEKEGSKQAKRIMRKKKIAGSEESSELDTKSKRDKRKKGKSKKSSKKERSETDEEDEEPGGKKGKKEKGKGKARGKKGGKSKKGESDEEDEESDHDAKKGKGKPKGKKGGKSKKGEFDEEDEESDHDAKKGKGKPKGKKGGKGKKGESESDMEDEKPGAKKGKKEKGKGKAKDKKIGKSKKGESDEEGGESDHDAKKGKGKSKGKKGGKSKKGEADTDEESEESDNDAKKGKKEKGKAKSKGGKKDKGKKGESETIETSIDEESIDEDKTVTGKDKYKKKIKETSITSTESTSTSKELDASKIGSEEVEGTKKARKATSDGSTPKGSKRSSKSKLIEESDEDSRVCKPELYPTYKGKPHKIAIICSDLQNYSDLSQSIEEAFNNVDRIMIISDEKNFVIFKYKDVYFLHEGCTCSIELFKYMDISSGTAGLKCYENINALVSYILCNKVWNIDSICEEYSRIENNGIFPKYNDDFLKPEFDNTKNLTKNDEVKKNRKKGRSNCIAGETSKKFQNVVKEICKILDNSFKFSQV